MRKINLSWSQVQSRAQKVAEEVDSLPHPIKIYGVPRGGIYAALAVLAYIEGKAFLVEKPDDDCIFIDDIIDTGETREGFREEYQYDGIPFYALVDKQGKDKHLGWVSFPWERMLNEGGPVENIRRLLEYIGEDPERDGLRETPQRVIKSYEKLFGGYQQKPSEVIKTFRYDACDEMVLVKDIEFYSTCEHHMLPFYGKAHIAYIPKDGKVIGVSKLARVLEIYSRRLQIQERLCQQVTSSLENMLLPLGTACVLEAQHLCMVCRGVEKQNSIMVTSSLTGVFKDKPEARAEFMRLIGK